MNQWTIDKAKVKKKRKEEEREKEREIKLNGNDWKDERRTNDWERTYHAVCMY